MSIHSPWTWDQRQRDRFLGMTVSEMVDLILTLEDSVEEKDGDIAELQERIGELEQAS